MSDFGNDLVYRFSQQAHPGRLTALGQGIRDVGLGIRQRRKERDRLDKYTDLFNQFQETQDPTLIPQLQEIAPEKFEGFQKAYDMMDEIQRKSTVKNNMEVYGYLATGNADLASEKLAALSRAYRAEGDYGEADLFQDMSSEVLAGNTDEVMNFLGISTGAVPEGQEALANYRAMIEERRQGVMTDAQVIKLMNEAKVTSPEEKARLGPIAKTLPSGVGDRLVDLMTVRNAIDTGDMSPEELFKAEQALRKEFDAYTKNFNKVVDGATEIEKLSALGTGFSDQAMIMNFNKVLDPDSVVRESEARMTADNQSLVNKGRTYLSALKAGERLSDDARQELLDSVKVMSELASGEITLERDRIGKTIRDFGFSDERIFPAETEEAPAPVTPSPTVPTGVPQVQGDRLSAKRAFVKQSNPQSNADFDNMTEDQLNQYRAGKVFDARNPSTEETVEVDW